MWLFTPDLAYNTNMYRSIWATGSDTVLHLLPLIGEEEDYILFDSCESAVKAFDAVINGINNGNKTLFIREESSYNGKTKLVVEYDKPYQTITQNDDSCIIKDPRIWNEETGTLILCPAATYKS